MAANKEFVPGDVVILDYDEFIECSLNPREKTIHTILDSLFSRDSFWSGIPEEAKGGKEFLIYRNEIDFHSDNASAYLRHFVGGFDREKRTVSIKLGDRYYSFEKDSRIWTGAKLTGKADLETLKVNWIDE